MRKPDSTVARRAFLDRRCNDNTHNGTNCFSARKRYFRVQRLFFAYFFLARQKRNQTANQRSVCCLERTSSAMGETCRLRRGEGYGACEDESPKAQLQRRCKNGTSGESGKEFRACGAAGGQHPQGVCRIRSAPSSLTAARGRPPLQCLTYFATKSPGRSAPQPKYQSIAWTMRAQARPSP